MTGPAKSPWGNRHWVLERLERRDAPAMASFRAGINNVVVQDVAISNILPSQSDPLQIDLRVEGKTGSSNHSQVLIRFDNLIGLNPGQIPPQATIVHANLVFWAKDGSSTKAPVQINRLLQPWNPNAANWDSWVDGVDFNNVEALAASDSTVNFGPHGYEATGQLLKQSIQSWADGQNNHGWVITLNDSQNFWTMASSEELQIDRRPCLNVEFTAPGIGNPDYYGLAGAPPLATSLDWFDWNNNLRNQRVARVPLERATTFFFSQSGDDEAGLGTVEHPWKTLGKAFDVLEESGGQGMRLRFQRGDKWNEATHFHLGHHVSGFTFDDYGDASLAKPLLTRFLPLAESGWEHVSGNLYKYVNPGPVGWVRESADGFSRIYYRSWTSEEVGLRPQSWYYDFAGLEAPSGGQPTLYLNCGQDPAAVSGGFEYCPNDRLGWEVRGDNIRMQNVRLEGYGVSHDGLSYGLAIYHQTDLREFVGIGLEVYYTGYHAIGHLVQYEGSKGAVTLIDCSAGLCVNRFGNGAPGSGDTTVYVAYGDYGGNEYVSYNCEAKYGTLPSSDWAATPGAGHGSAFYCHVGPGGTLDLVIMEKTRTGDYGYSVRSRNSFDSLPPASTLSHVRGFLVEDGPGPGVSRFIGSDIAVINCVFDYTNPPRDFDYHYSFHYNAITKGYLINTTVAIDAVNQTSFFFSVLHSVYLNRVQAFHCHFDMFNAEVPLYWDIPFASGLIYLNTKLINSIVSFSTSATTGLGPPNDPATLRNNAYFLPNLAEPGWGYSNDVGAVTLQRRYPVGLRPTTSSPLFDAGLPGVVEYYQDRTPRGAISTIGPRSEVELPRPLSTTAHWGQQSVNLYTGTRLWSPHVNRIALEFNQNVDLGITALELSNANGPVAWSGINFDDSTNTAVWTLAQPLAPGHYTLTLDGQALRTFSVLPGDFNGDGIVTVPDFNVFRQSYGTMNFVGDLDGDGLVSAVDFILFRQFFGAIL